MIPKKIHYCWYGSNKLPPLYERCLNTWNKHIPDYEVILWNEENTIFDTPYLKEKLKNKEWAFIADYIRMRALYEHGGIYLDADIEVVKRIDPLLNSKCFLGYEEVNRLNTGVLGSIAGHNFPKKCMDLIDSRHSEKKPYLIAPEIAAEAINLCSVDDQIKKYPPEYFYPYNPYDKTKKIKNLMLDDITDNTYCVHHWGKGWKQSIIARVLKKILK